MRFRRLRRAAQVGRVARRSHVLRVLREVGVLGERPATAERAREFRLALGQLAERLEEGTLKVGVAATDLRGLDRLMRSVANRIGAALIIVGLLVSSALIARVYEWLALAGFLLGVAVGLYMIWKIVRTPGEL